MASSIYREIIKLILRAATLAKSIGISNILQPGLVKEMIIADTLGHVLIHSKRDADAHALGNPEEKYEYMSCVEGGSGQLDRIFKEPYKKRQTSLERITRNKSVFFAVFYKNDQVRCKVIYELSVESVLRETNRQLDRSRNDISHVGFSERWAKENGTVVYEDVEQAPSEKE